MAGMAGVASAGGLGSAAAAQEGDGTRDFYELRTYHLETEAQAAGLEAFLKDAAVPALNRAGVSPVGVFNTPDEVGPVYVLLQHASLESVGTLTEALGADEEFLTAGAAFLDAPSSSQAYARMESALLAAFSGMPKLETPATSDTRVFQLRIYESPSVKTGQKKIEMFNTAEIAIFRKVGLNPVFFGESLVGAKMPNLTYMLAFESMDEQKAAWGRFGKDPDWRELSAMPEYANDKILCGITNLSLRPSAASQI